MASSGAQEKRAADPWTAWDEALEQVALPQDPRNEFYPMPAFLQEILSSFAEFDPKTLRMDGSSGAEVPSRRRELRRGVVPKARPRRSHAA